MQRKGTSSIVMLVGAVLLVVGSVLPWVSIPKELADGADIGSTSGVSGTDGWIIILGAFLIGFAGVLRRQGQLVPKWLRIASGVAGLLALAIGAANFSDVGELNDLLALASLDASVGIGLWLVIAGSVACLVGMFVLASREDGAIWFKQPAGAAPPAAPEAPTE